LHARVRAPARLSRARARARRAHVGPREVRLEPRASRDISIFAASDLGAKKGQTIARTHALAGECSSSRSARIARDPLCGLSAGDQLLVIDCPRFRYPEASYDDSGINRISSRRRFMELPCRKTPAAGFPGRLPCCVPVFTVLQPTRDVRYRHSVNTNHPEQQQRA